MATVLTFVVVRAHLAELCFAVITSVAVVSNGGVGTVTGAPHRCCASWDAGVLARITIGACRTSFAVLASVPSSPTVAAAAPRRACHNPQILTCVAICAGCARVGSFTVGTAVPSVRTVTSAAHASARRGSRVLAGLAVCTFRTGICCLTIRPTETGVRTFTRTIPWRSNNKPGVLARISIGACHTSHFMLAVGATKTSPRAVAAAVAGRTYHISTVLAYVAFKTPPKNSRASVCSLTVVTTVARARTVAAAITCRSGYRP